MPPEGAGRGAGRVEEDRVELAGRLPPQRVCFDELRRQDACVLDSRAVVRDDFPMHRLR